MSDPAEDDRWREMLAAFDRKSAANLEKAAALVLVERDDEGRWCVRLWHGVTNTKTSERAGVRTLWTFGDDGGGKASAREMAGVLAWWLAVSLNLHGKRPAPAAKE